MRKDDAAYLRLELRRRWEINRRGGLRARVSRWRVFHWIVLQRLGQIRWVGARVFWGDSIRLLTGEVISSGILSFGYSETALTALMIEILKPGMRVVDVGAHLGYEAMLASVLVGRDGTVISFEPQQQIADWARINLNSYPQARLVQAAVGDAHGSAEFIELGLIRSAFSGISGPSRDIAGMEGLKTYRAEIRTLDKALAAEDRPVDFIKCDAEGGEMSVLRGALDILTKDKPFLVLEAEMPQMKTARPRVKEFTEFLSPMGYQGLSFDYDGELKLGPLGSLDEGHANVAFIHTSRMQLLANLRNE